MDGIIDKQTRLVDLTVGDLLELLHFGERESSVSDFSGDKYEYGLDG